MHKPIKVFTRRILVMQETIIVKRIVGLKVKNEGRGVGVSSILLRLQSYYFGN